MHVNPLVSQAKYPAFIFMFWPPSFGRNRFLSFIVRQFMEYASHFAFWFIERLKDNKTKSAHHIIMPDFHSRRHVSDKWLFSVLYSFRVPPCKPEADPRSGGGMWETEGGRGQPGLTELIGIVLTVFPSLHYAFYRVVRLTITHTLLFLACSGWPVYWSTWLNIITKPDIQ